jgi:acetyl-CoA carboxylase biotin carboxyl carrier protein
MAKDKHDLPSDGEQTLIRELANLLNETGLTEIELEKSGLKIRVTRHTQLTAFAPPALTPAALPASAAPPASPAPAASAAAEASPPAGAVKSPMVGTVYLAPEPGMPPFVDVGTQVSEGQTLLIIEAMKTMNHIPAPRAGTVRQILVENNQPIEYGEPLVVIE